MDNKQRSQQMLEKIKKNARPNAKNVLGGIGDSAALYSLAEALSGAKYQEPVLVSRAASVGPKLQLALDLGVYHSVGQDCLALCVNDILCSGAEPLFFLDYLGCENLDVDTAAALINGIGAVCASMNIPLLGGETAQLFDLSQKAGSQAGFCDLTGFCVGLVERQEIYSSERSTEGDVLIGLSSSGLHSSGFSLLRKILNDCESKYHLDYNQPLLHTENGKKSLKEALLNPSTIYTSLVKSLLHSDFSSSIHAMAQIGEGGIAGSLPRALQADQLAEIDRKHIRKPKIFDFLQEPQKYLGGSGSSEGPLVSSEDMWANFNMGLGFVLVVAEEAAEKILELCDQHSSFGQELIAEDALYAGIIGRISKRSSEQAPQVLFS